MNSISKREAAQSLPRSGRRSAGETAVEQDATVLAGVLTDGLEGATLRAEVVGSTDPLTAFVDVVFSRILV